jgi:hypothetical protein
LSPKRIFTLLILAGIVLDIVGLFLPWIAGSPVEQYGISVGDMLGINIFFGWAALFWCVFAAVFGVLFMIKPDKYLLSFIVICGILTTLCSLASIESPNTLWGGVSAFDYSTAYGVYVSLAGGILVLIGATCHAYIGGIRDWIRNLGSQDQYSGD